MPHLFEKIIMRNLIFLFPVTKVSFETYTSQIIPGRDRTWSGMIILIVKTQRDNFTSRI